MQKLTPGQIIAIPLVIEGAVWFFLRRFLPDIPTCPICGQKFAWSETVATEADSSQQGRKPFFPCPNCQQVIGVPDWREPFLKFSYIALGICFFALFCVTHTRSLLEAYCAALLAALGAVKIADIFIWRKLEPGRPSSLS
jgi:hypothetical protein